MTDQFFHSLCSVRASWGPSELTAEITYQLTPTDIRAVRAALYQPAWGARHWGRYERVRLTLAGMSLAGFIVLLLKAFSLHQVGTDLFGWDMVMSAMGAGAFMGWIWGKWKTSLPAADNPLFQPMNLSVDEQGIRVRGHGFDNQMDWNQVTQLRLVGGYLLISTRLSDNPIVPLHAFATSEAADTFVVQANAFHDMALNPPDRMPLEQIGYQLDRDDVLAFFKLHREPTGWRALLFYVVLFAGIFAFGLLAEGMSDSHFWLGLAIAVGAAWMLAKLILLLERNLAVARHPLPEGDVELQRWGDHLHLFANGKVERVDYAQIGKVITTDEHVFLMTAPRQAYIVPLHAFSGAAEMAAFAEAVDRSVKESQP